MKCIVGSEGPVGQGKDPPADEAERLWELLVADPFLNEDQVSDRNRDRCPRT